MIAAIGKYGCLLTIVDEKQRCRTKMKMNVDGPSCISIQTQHILFHFHHFNILLLLSMQTFIDTINFKPFYPTILTFHCPSLHFSLTYIFFYQFFFTIYTFSLFINYLTLLGTYNNSIFTPPDLLFFFQNTNSSGIRSSYLKMIWYKIKLPKNVPV